MNDGFFSRFRAEHISDEVYRALQNELLEDPEKGDIVKGLNQEQRKAVNALLELIKSK